MSMRNLTLASAKHLLSMGHLTPAQHTKIVSAASPAPPKLKKPRMPMAFGSLAPQSAQSPIPPIANGNPETEAE